jgi:hypothetical protein
MEGIADMGGVVGRSATYALARAEPALAERRGGAGYLGRGLNGAEVEGKFAPQLSGGKLVSAEPWESGAFAMAVTIHAQELSDRPTDKDREH